MRTWLALGSRTVPLTQHDRQALRRLLDVFRGLGYTTFSLGNSKGRRRDIPTDVGKWTVEDKMFVES